MWAYALSENDMLQSVLKIKVYGQDSISKNYIFVQWGSAVAIDSKRIITNAHVILNDATWLPLGNYEICKSKPDTSAPICFTTARLVSYDSVADLAVLELSTPISGAKKMTFQEKSISIGSNAIVYGYPSIGGESITRTEWKIGGMEGESYKFDGTIDHGNSGGGAFDTRGNLIGIPYAVSSDNGVIGYIIPYSIVKKFLSGKTDNIEKYARWVTSEFKSYINNLENLWKNMNLISTKYVTIKDIWASGFSLVNAVESRERSIFDYRFVHKNNRVSLITYCSKDAMSTKKSTIEIARDTIAWYNLSDSRAITTELPSVENWNHTLLTTSTVEESGQKWVMFEVFNDKTPNCSAIVIAQDVKKDMSIYMKALNIAKKVQFSNVETVKQSYDSVFYKNFQIPENLYVTESTSLDDLSIVPKIGTIFGQNFYTSDRLKVETFVNLNGYMNIGYDASQYYKGADFSFDAFIKRFVTTDDPKIVEVILTSKNGKKFILSYINPTTDNQSRVIFSYPFKTEAGELKFYQYQFDYPSKNEDFERTIKAFFENTELPGTSPFPN